MRAIITFSGCLVLTAALFGQQAGQPAVLDRYQIPYTPQKYPQDTPQKALQAIARAVIDGNLSYLMAHLADPAFVDRRVEEIKKGLEGPDDARLLVAFDEVVKETAQHFRSDPKLVRELGQFAREGQWEVKGKEAIARLPGVQDHVARLKEIQGRWYLENRR